MMLLTGMTSYILVQREFQRIEQEYQRQAERMGHSMQESLTVAYRSEGREGVIRAVKTMSADGYNVQVRWVWFDEQVGDPERPAVPAKSFERIQQGDIVSFYMHDESGKSRLATYYLFNLEDQTGNARKGGLELTGSLEETEREARHKIWTGLISVGAMALFCAAIVVIGGFLMIGRPLKRLIKQADSIGEGKFDEPQTISRNDELGQLGLALRNMSRKLAEQQDRIRTESASRIATLEQLRHADRLKTVGRLAAGIAHEIGTPLNVVAGRAGLIAGGKLSQEDIVASANTIRTEADRITQIVRQLLDFARANTPNRKETDLRVTLQRTLELLQPLANKRNVKFHFAADTAPVTALVDDGQIQQVTTNLLMNAVQSMPDGGRVDIRLERVTGVHPKNAEQQSVGEAKYFRIDIQDHGHGIAAEDVEQIFEPFFTTKDVGEGTGLGLSIAYGIIQEHQGWIDVNSELGKGTTFSIYLPTE